MKTGIFSGAFDPVHAGHMAFCATALSKGLDRIFLLPEERPRGKPHVSSLEHRVAMIKLAIRDSPHLSLLQLESSQFSVSETLPELQRHFPNDNLTLLVGSDVVHTFQYRWPGLEDLFASVSLLIGVRGEDSCEDLDKVMHALQVSLSMPISYEFVTATEHAAVASSQIRAGAVVSHVMPAVATYINMHRLYTYDAFPPEAVL